MKRLLKFRSVLIIRIRRKSSLGHHVLPRRRKKTSLEVEGSPERAQCSWLSAGEGDLHPRSASAACGATRECSADSIEQGLLSSRSCPCRWRHPLGPGRDPRPQRRPCRQNVPEGWRSHRTPCYRWALAAGRRSQAVCHWRELA